MASSDLGSRDILNSDTGHTDGTHGHDVMNDWIDIATRPASTQAINHTGGGALNIDVNLGHVVNVQVQSNITSVAFSNLNEGHPILLVLYGDGVSSYTADLSAINLDANTTLNSSLGVDPTDVHHINITKVPANAGSKLWAPAGVVSINQATVSGIVPQATAELVHSGSFSTSHLFPLPAGIQVGDHLHVFTVTQEDIPNEAVDPSIPSGWNRRFAIGGDVGFRARINMFEKIADGTEGSSVNITWGVSIRAHGCSHRISGVDQTTPFDAGDSTATVGSSNPDPASVTTVTPDAMVIAIAAGNVNGGSTATLPGGYSVLVNQDAYDRSIITCYKMISTPGSEDPAAFVWACFNSTTRTICLRPAT